jgi:hypothetical protein
MIDFYLYNDDGQIVMTGSCCEQDLDLQKRPDLHLSRGKADFRAQYVNRGGELRDMPPRPSQFHNFNYKTKRWVGDETAAWAGVRTRRAELLAACDWTQLPDVPAGTRERWAEYRQQLRDITDAADPYNVPWPPSPAL